MDFSILTPKVVFEFFLRVTHFLAGITWIGFLYWFNLVNVNFQKTLEADVKPKVNPKLIPPTLWFFRWGAVVTVLSGFLYYVSILHGEPDSGAWTPLMTWILVIGITYAIIYNVIRPEGILNNGRILAGIISVIVILMAVVLFVLYRRQGVITNPAYAIGVGGGLGVIMLLNVWGIIWPAQKRVLGLVPVQEGVEKTELARRAFLASRVNTWLSIPMLIFMAGSTHLPLIRWY
ncbi:MAG: urate hydroxylase PuuD [Elusimicrobia bacterium]|nr:urate hydroxylase PuuD [Elusimicrobiota bacterium]